jgi:hypothetical protein
VTQIALKFSDLLFLLVNYHISNYPIVIYQVSLDLHIVHGYKATSRSLSSWILILRRRTLNPFPNRKFPNLSRCHLAGTPVSGGRRRQLPLF